MGESGNFQALSSILTVSVNLVYHHSGDEIHVLYNILENLYENSELR